MRWPGFWLPCQALSRTGYGNGTSFARMTFSESLEMFYTTPLRTPAVRPCEVCSLPCKIYLGNNGKEYMKNPGTLEELYTAIDRELERLEADATD
jgi:hypothetical protein